MRYPDTDDYKNLLRLMNYRQGAIGLPFILSIEKYGNIKWYVGTAFAVYKGMRRHTGGFSTMITGGASI